MNQRLKDNKVLVKVKKYTKRTQNLGGHLIRPLTFCTYKILYIIIM